MTRAEMRAWITSKLDPIETWDPARRIVHSDVEPAQADKPLAPAAVLVPLVEHEEGVTVLLTRRADTLRNHTGQVAFPGGRCEPGELPWETALREAHEEVGLEPSHVTIAGLSSGYQTRTGFDITPVVAFVRPGFALVPNPDEVADVFETPFAFLMDPNNHERRFLEQAEGLRRYFYAMTYEDRTIWGVTAGMLRVLYERLYGAPSEAADPEYE
ncbi:MAG TPA: CoA pyrophosphatase [Caulobacteraceae bacterium]|jgi:8-oxo-dGTP pyrophosphatase MutT (NUDIX family)|nr:CoA pyrophosphatase [Caulobacteraceae bacterium]